MGVVGPAAELDVRDGGRATVRPGTNVVKLDAASLLTALSRVSHESATPSVPDPDRPLHLGRNVARTLLGWTPAKPRARRGRKLLAREILQEGVQCPPH